MLKSGLDNSFDLSVEFISKEGPKKLK
jgi:hypothetical protein